MTKKLNHSADSRTQSDNTSKNTEQGSVILETSFALTLLGFAMFTVAQPMLGLIEERGLRSTDTVRDVISCSGVFTNNECY